MIIYLNLQGCKFLFVDIKKRVEFQIQGSNICKSGTLFLMKTKFYQWWKNHRRIVTTGLFLSILAFYLKTPFDKEAKIKDTCGKLNSSYQITGDEAMKDLNLKEIKNYNNRELANYYCERYLGIK